MVFQLATVRRGAGWRRGIRPGDALSDIQNPDDVETISVLKGAVRCRKPIASLGMKRSYLHYYQVGNFKKRNGVGISLNSVPSHFRMLP